jgi:hypothetical protein
MFTDLRSVVYMSASMTSMASAIMMMDDRTKSEIDMALDIDDGSLESVLLSGDI